MRVIDSIRGRRSSGPGIGRREVLAKSLLAGGGRRQAIADQSETDRNRTHFHRLFHPDLEDDAVFDGEIPVDDRRRYRLGVTLRTCSISPGRSSSVRPAA